MRIAITGPESSGKSTLAFSLSEHYKIPLVQEFARDYLIQLQRPYEESDLLLIAKGQLSLWDQFSQEKSFVSDTEMLVLKIWSEVKYQRCDAFIFQALDNQKFDKYLLCYPDISWQKDGLREHPYVSDRLRLFSLYEESLQILGCDYSVIKGEGESRLELATQFLDSTL